MARRARWIGAVLALAGGAGAGCRADMRAIRASPAAQAQALADLADALGLERVADMDMSGGAVRALHFTALFTERTRALVLLSTAPFARPWGDAGQAPPIPIRAYDALFASNFPYWALSRMVPGTLLALFDAGPAQMARATSAERAVVAAMVRRFLPVTAGTAWLANEGAAIAPGSDAAPEAIVAPTLIVRARDDALAPHASATHAAGRIAGAELVSLPDGGHLLLVHHAALRVRIAALLAAAD